MTRIPNVGGVILCGGRSRRMGRSKALLTLGGRTFLEVVASTLSEVVSPIVIAAAAEQALPALPADVEAIVVRDEEPYEGPLTALARALESLPAGVEAAYVSGCDNPLLTAEWVRAVVGALGSAEAAWVEIDGRAQPLASAYRRSAATAARRLLADGIRRASILGNHLAKVVVDHERLLEVDPELRSLRNVNSPADLEEIERRRARLDGESAGSGCRG